MHDLIYCFRMLRKRPSFTLVAVLTLGLAIGASTALFSIVHLVVLNPFPYKDPSRLFLVRQSLPKIGVQDQLRAFFQSVIDRVKTLPGIEAAGVASHMPFVYTEDWPITVETVANAGAQTQSIDTRTVSADYFTTMQIPMVGGQFFSSGDGPEAPPVIMVNQAMVNRYWPNQDPLGKRIKIGNLDSKSPWFSVKGIVKDSAQSALDQEIKPEIYFALGQMAGRYRRMNLAVRTSGDPKITLAAIQSAIREVDKRSAVRQSWHLSCKR